MTFVLFFFHHESNHSSECSLRNLAENYEMVVCVF